MLDAARQRYDAQAAYYKEGRITLDRFADASYQLAEAELRTAKTPYERTAIKKRHLDRLKEIESREETELKNGRGTQSDVSEATMRRIEAELDLHEAVNSKGETDLAPILRRLGELERQVKQLQKEDAADRIAPESCLARNRASPSIRPYGRRIASLTIRWNSSRSLS